MPTLPILQTAYATKFGNSQSLKPRQPTVSTASINSSITPRLPDTFTGVLEQSQLDHHINSAIKSLSAKKAAFITSGHQGRVWLFPHLKGPAYPDGLAIKQYYQEQINNGGNDLLHKELNNLKKLSALKLPNIVHLLQKVETAASPYMIMPLMKGEEIPLSKWGFSHSHYRDLFAMCHTLDQAGLYNWDLNGDNILITKKNLNFIDVAQIEPYKKNKLGEASGVYTTPPHSTAGNFRSFEACTLYVHMNGLKNPSLARQVFIDYLKARSDHHSQRAVSLKTRKPESFLMKSDLDKAAQLEEIQARLLKNPSTHVINLEARQCQLSSLWLDLYNFLNFNKENEKKFQHAITAKSATFKVIKSSLEYIEKLQKTSPSPDMLDYLHFQKEAFKAWQNKFQNYTITPTIFPEPKLEKQMLINPLIQKM